ncbi:hypothetical protein F2P81_020871 [Scophthalmus maximus]|uniref:Uncharacterized protein n=1 Tax=Scophthalmus maximus TaxID=52904 RepID=A0A6A4S6E0_SCOMX|nr:hypothetical protein F2P81_020871 [Scophthalmus maximus]
MTDTALILLPETKARRFARFLTQTEKPPRTWQQGSGDWNSSFCSGSLVFIKPINNTTTKPVKGISLRHSDLDCLSRKHRVSVSQEQSEGTNEEGDASTGSGGTAHV